MAVRHVAERAFFLQEGNQVVPAMIFGENFPLVVIASQVLFRFKAPQRGRQYGGEILNAGQQRISVLREGRQSEPSSPEFRQVLDAHENWTSLAR